MANWLSLGAECGTFWGNVTRGAECAARDDWQDGYGRWQQESQVNYERSQEQQEKLVNVSKELLVVVGMGILILAFLVFYLKS